MESSANTGADAGQFVIDPGSSTRIQSLQMPESFQELPAELLRPVLEQLDQSSLWSCSLTCKNWNIIATQELYGSVEFKDRQGLTLARTITESPYLGQHVRQLSFDYSFLCADRHAAKILKFTPELTFLKISSPWSDQPDGWRYDKDERPEGNIDWPAEAAAFANIFKESQEVGSKVLSKIQECHLEFCLAHGNPGYWNMGSRDILFLNKQIEVLSFRHGFHDIVQADDVIWDFYAHRNTTELEDLTFDRCQLELEAFHRILSFPRALKHLSYTYLDMLGEDLESLSGPLDAPLFAKAVAQQRGSLETLHLQGMYHGLLGARFGDFIRLKYLDVELGVLFGRGRVLSHGRGFEPSDVAIEELLPASLESLVLRYGARTNPARDHTRRTVIGRMLAQRETHLPRLKKLLLLREGIFANDQVFDDLLADCSHVGVELEGNYYGENCTYFHPSMASPP